MKKLFVIPVVSTCLLALMISGCGDNAKPSDAVESPQPTTETSDVQTGTKEAGETTDAAANEKSDVQKETDEKKDGDTANSTVDHESIYAPILDEVADIVNSGYDYDKSYKYAGNGLMEKAMYPGDKPLAETVGYVLEDISGDGIPELMIGCDEDYSDFGSQSYLFSVFSIKGNKPVQIIDGWARNSYRWIGDGHFYYFGSGGAAYSYFGECHLSEDGTKELWDDFYLTDEKDGGSIGLYHNNTGSSESSQSEELSISEDEFWNKMDEYEARCKLLNWTHIGNSVNYEALYEPVFTEILDVIDYGYNMDREYSYATGNLTDVIDSGEKKNPLDEIGYTLEDISGDGVPELIVGYDANYSNSGNKSYVSGVYTLKDDKPVVTYAGSARSTYQRVDDTHFFFMTSGGVSLTIMGNNHLSKDGTEIVWDKCYFTDEKNDGSIGYYQNTTGIVDAGKSEEMESGEDAFVEIMSDCLEYTIPINWTPIGKCIAR